MASCLNKYYRLLHLLLKIRSISSWRLSFILVFWISKMSLSFRIFSLKSSAAISLCEFNSLAPCLWWCANWLTFRLIILPWYIWSWYSPALVLICLISSQKLCRLAHELKLLRLSSESHLLTGENFRSLKSLSSSLLKDILLVRSKTISLNSLVLHSTLS